MFISFVGPIFILDCIHQILYSYGSNAFNVFVVNFEEKFHRPVTRYALKEDKIPFSLVKPDFYIIKSEQKRLKSILKYLENYTFFNPRAKFFIITDEVQKEFVSGLDEFFINAIILEEISKDLYNLYSYEKLNYDIITNIPPRNSCAIYEDDIEHISKSVEKSDKEMFFLKVGITNNIPSIILKGGSPIAGIEFELLNLVAEKLKFKVEYEEVDNFGGTKDKFNLSFNGAFGALQRKEKDMVMGGILATSDSTIHFDLTHPTSFDSYAWIVPAAELRPFWKRLIYTFTSSVWMLLHATIGVTTILLTLANNFVSETSFRWETELFKLYSMSIQTVEMNSSNLHSKNILYISWCFFLIVYVNCFTAKLLTNLMIKKYEYQINTKEEIRATGWRTCSFADLVESFDGLENASEIITCTSCEICTNRTAFQRDLISVRSRNLVRYDMSRLYIGKEGEPLIFFLDTIFVRVQNSMVFRKNHPIFKRFDEIMKRLISSGLTHKIASAYKRKKIEENEVQWQSLRFTQLSFMFQFLSYGLILGFSVFIFERIMARKQHEKNNY